jgi:uncharacterized membrane protein (UPF0127 family)
MTNLDPGRISILILGTLLIGCSSPAPALSPTQNSNASPSSQRKQLITQTSGQMLPVSAEVTINGQVIELEVALTPAQQEMGLMYRTELPPNRGMLFPFNPVRRVGFWMKNCRIPLDMVFLYQGQVRSITHNAPPCIKDPCPIYDSKAVIGQVIELSGGQAKELGLKVGDRLTVQPR